VEYEDKVKPVVGFYAGWVFFLKTGVFWSLLAKGITVVQI
jgi:hypothetical protein